MVLNGFVLIVNLIIPERDLTGSNALYRSRIDLVFSLMHPLLQGLCRVGGQHRYPGL